MVEEHNFKEFPELTNAQLESEGLTSPHVQITEDFWAVVVKVTDGDTITLHTDFRDFDFPLRFLDVDAPEMNAESGPEVRDWLASMIEGDEVQIVIDRNNRVGKYGRLLGRVISRGMNMGEVMLGLGFVVPFGKKREGEVALAEKVFSLKQWF